MLSDFRKFVGFKILEYFLQYPTKKTYLKELAKELFISPRSVKIYCDLFEKDGIIIREITGNVHQFSLNNTTFQVREMKRAYYANLLAEHKIQQIASTCISLAIYGSYATGEYDEKSDIDILLIGTEDPTTKKKIVDLMHILDKEIQLTVLSLAQWETMKHNNDAFARTILRNHILLAGAEL